MNTWKQDLYMNELYHHGILGMKWGVRNGKNYPLSSSEHSASERKAGWRESLNEKKVAKYEKKMNKKIAKHEAFRDKIMANRKKNLQKISDRYDKKISKLEKDRDSFKPIKNGLKTKSGKTIMTSEDVKYHVNKYQSKIDTLKANKKRDVSNFKSDNKYVKAGMNKYIDVVKKNKKANIKAFSDKAFKNSPEYKKAVKDYTRQTINDLTGSSSLTKLNYAQEFAKNANK